MEEGDWRLEIGDWGYAVGLMIVDLRLMIFDGMLERRSVTSTINNQQTIQVPGGILSRRDVPAYPGFSLRSVHWA